MSYSNCQFTWLKQRETLVSLAESLLKDAIYFDCQLCAEGYHFNVHRVILSCNSPVLNSILQEHNSDLPVITLEGVSSVEVAALVEFMYTGVTRISPNYLKNFFQLAKSLQLAGLIHYDNAEIHKIINESETEAIKPKIEGNYEVYSQNILKYLDQSESSAEPVSKDLTTITNDENIFLDESPETNEAESDNPMVYEKYEDTFIKENDSVETLETSIEETDLSQSCAVDSNEVDGASIDTPLMYNKYHSVFIKNESDTIADTITPGYSISKIRDIDCKEENEYIELQDDLKVTNEDENFVYVKLDNIALVKMKESQLCKVKPNLTKNEIQLLTEKNLKLLNPVEKNFVVKKSKTPSVSTKNSGTSPQDKKIYICLKCGNKYSHRRTLLHHIHWICEQPATYSCSLCPYRGKRKFQLKSHMKHAHLLKMS